MRRITPKGLWHHAVQFVGTAMVFGSFGCGSSGPSAPNVTPSTGPAPVYEKGKTPEGLGEGKAFTKGGITKIRKSAIKTAAPNGPS